MKILFLSFTDILNENGARTRIFSELKQLRGGGVNLYYVAFVYWRTFINSRHSKMVTKRHINELGVKVFIVPLIPTFKLGFLGIKLQTMWAVLVLLITVRFYGISTIHAHINNSAYIALKLKKVSKIKVIFDMHGASSEEIRATDLPTNAKEKQIKVANEIEKECIKGADRVICVSKSMTRYLKNKYHDIDMRIDIIPCLTDVDKFIFSERIRKEMRQKYNIDDKFVIVYSGTLVKYQLIDDMCRMFSIIKEKIPNSFFTIYTSSNLNELHKSLNECKILESDYSIGFVPHESINEHIMMCDVGLLLRENIVLNNVASPTKLGEYLSSGVPVVATPYIGDIIELYNKDKLGFLINLENKAESELFDFLNDVKAHRLEWAYRCNAFVQNHLSWQKYRKTLIHLYKFD